MSGRRILEAMVLFAGEPPAPALVEKTLRGGSIPWEVFLIRPQPSAIATYLTDPNQPLTLAERRSIGRCSSALTLRGSPAGAVGEELVSLAVGLLGLVRLGGLAAALPAAGRIVGSAWLLAHADHLATATVLASLFLHQHRVRDAGTAWCHTHGMEQLALPDLECRLPAADAELAARLLERCADFLLTGSGPLEAGDVVEVEVDGELLTLRIETASETPDHPYGLYGALELVYLSRRWPGEAGVDEPGRLVGKEYRP